MSLILSEQEQVRRGALKEMYDLGINPFPPEAFDVTTTTRLILRDFAASEAAFQEVSIAGRIMSRRIMGAASFCELQDANGRIQLYFKRDDICPGEDKTMYNTVFKRLLDIGDIIGVRGYVFVTQMGEITIHVRELKVLSKSLRPLPIVKEKDGQIYDAFTDPEQRFRMRYVDLIVNESVRETFIKRTKIINSMRNFFNEQGYLEVETPILQPIPGGAAARPFITHHNALDIPLYLRVANELYLKRLIVGGFDGVYEFSKDFRNEGMDRTHNPEFTVMEIYVAYKDYHWMMEFTEKMLERVAVETTGGTKVTVNNNEIEFKTPFKRITILDAIKEHTGFDVSQSDEAELRTICRKLGVEINEAMGKGKLIDELFGEKTLHMDFLLAYGVGYVAVNCYRHVRQIVEGIAQNVNGYNGIGCLVFVRAFLGKVFLLWLGHIVRPKIVPETLDVGWELRLLEFDQHGFLAAINLFYNGFEIQAEQCQPPHIAWQDSFLVFEAHFLHLNIQNYRQHFFGEFVVLHQVFEGLVVQRIYDFHVRLI